MGQEKTEAMVLRSVDFSNSSRIVTFLTPNRGKLACIARGARRKGNQQGPLLDTMNRLEILYFWKDGRSVQPLGEIALLDNYAALKSDLESSAFAAFPLEVALKVVHENEPAEMSYATLTAGLEALARRPQDIRLAVCALAMALLSDAGFAPETEVCVCCGASVGPAPSFLYEGGVTCRHCRYDRRLSREAYTLLRRWQDPDAARTTAPYPAEPGVRSALSAELFTLVSRYAAYQLDTAFRSVRVITDMFP